MITVAEDFALSSELLKPGLELQLDQATGDKAGSKSSPDDSLHDQAYEQIRGALMSGMLPPGTKVSIRKFATGLGMGSMPVREALKRLISERSLEAKENRTTVVRTLDINSFKEITEIRLSLEGLAAYHAAYNIVEGDLDKLNAINERMRDSSSHSPNEYLHLNRQFHFSVYRASEKPFLLDMIENMWVICGPMLTRIPGRSGKRTGEKHHALLLSALNARNGPAARAAVEGDITEGAARIMEHFD